MKKINCLFLGIIIGLLIVCILIMIDNKKLKEENKNLKEDIIDYKWQLEQVPYIVQSNLDSLCNS